MAWSLVLTDRTGRNRAFVDSFESLTITAHLDGERSLALRLHPRSEALSEVGFNRVLKAYDGSSLRFHGQLWEPLDYSDDAVTVNARDPYAVFSRRRVRASKTYTAEDAGAIVSDRVTIQNGFKATGLRMGTVQASVNRDRTYDPGKLESELIEQLSDVERGFNFLVTPLDGVAGIYGELQIRYPDAGTTREAVRFEYGTDTLDNLSGYEIAYLLPTNRVVVASQLSAGGRISQASEAADSVNEYGLLEEEYVYSDILVEATLLQHAEAEVRATPPMTVSLSPNLSAPLLFTDFDVGDFVRLRIEHGALDLYEWVRVLEATLTVDKNGAQYLSGLTVETYQGLHNTPPHEWLRKHLDESRARLEALERRVENMLATPDAPDAPPAPTEPDEPVLPDEPDPLPEPEPPAPPEPPSFTGFNAVGVNYLDAGGSLVRGVELSATLDRYATVTFNVGGATATVEGQSVSAFIAKGSGTYDATALASTSGGSDEAGPISVTVPAVTSA